MIRKSLLITAVLFTWIGCSPARAQVLALDTVLQRIDQNNPMLKEYDHKVEALNAYAGGASSWMAPMVGFGPYWFPYKRQEATHDFDPEDGMYMAVVEQDVPNPAKLKARKSYLTSKAATARDGRAVVLNELRSEARALYYQLLINYRKAQVLEEGQEILELMLKLAKLRYPYNQGTLGMIYRSEGRVHENKNMQLMTGAEQEALRIRLNALMNVSSDGTWIPDTTLLIHFQMLAVTDTSDLIASRSDLRQLQRRIEEMQFNQQVQRMNAKPDFKFRFEHMVQRDPAMPNQFSAMVMVTIPIAPWSSRMYRSEVKGMEYDIRAMQREREGIINESRGMLLSMRSQLTTMARQLENYSSKIIPAMRKNYETVMLAYEENREQLTSVVDAWEAYNMVQMDHLEKQQEYYNMIAQYEKELEN
jgi:outer membrane protein, heavy metal efflux system